MVTTERRHRFESYTWQMRRIMVTGAATWTGGRLIQRLERQPEVEVIAVDELPATVEFESPLHDLANANRGDQATAQGQR